MLSDGGFQSWVQTDMGDSGARALGLERAEVPVADSVAGMIKVVRLLMNGSFVFVSLLHGLTGPSLLDRKRHEGEDIGQVYALRRDRGGLVIG